MDNVYSQLTSSLNDVESCLKELALWSDTEPPADALASIQPFAVDTLEFVEWLQFIFLPRLHFMIGARETLPENCGIAPMAETYFGGSFLDVDESIAVLAVIDSLLSESV